MAKLTKGQIEGIRLLADALVIEYIAKNVFAKNPALAPHTESFRSYMRANVPEPFAAQAELEHQIKLVRSIWLEQLKNDPDFLKGKGAV